MVAYQSVDIYTRDDGTAWSETSTNDNLDRGYDSQDAHWTLQFPSVEAARKQHGVSRVGISGIKVTVRVDGEKV